jgi:beta-lactamase superfamily II metal-dependent hydrolase
LWAVAGEGGRIRTSQNIFDQIDVFGDAVTINSSSGSKTRDKWSVATAIKTGEDEWLITGDLSE